MTGRQWRGRQPGWSLQADLLLELTASFRVGHTLRGCTESGTCKLGVTQHEGGLGHRPFRSRLDSNPRHCEPVGQVPTEFPEFPGHKLGLHLQKSFKGTLVATAHVSA